MIPLLLILTASTMLVLPGIIGQPFRLRAHEWARAAAGSLLVGFVALEAALGLLALPTVLRFIDATRFATICDHALAPLAPGGPFLGWAALTLALVLGTRAGYAVWRARRVALQAEVEPWLGRHEDRGDFELVVLPTAELFAVSVRGTIPQVLVSEGLVQHLEPEELETVVDHEATHLRCKHWRFALLATAVERALWPAPLVARSTRSLRDALEAWADDGAVGRCDSRRASVQSAMFTVASNGGASRRPSSACTVRLRARRLAAPARPTPLAVRAVVFAPILVLGLTLVVLLLDWTAGAHHAAAMAGYCLD